MWLVWVALLVGLLLLALTIYRRYGRRLTER